MTPQERAEQVAHTYYSRGSTNLIDLIADALTATRRAALLEAAQRADLGDCNGLLLDAPCLWCGYNGEGYWQPTTHEPTCPWHNVGGRFNRVVALDRLAQEGALSIDLSPTIQDDGGYGEHF